MMKKENKFGPYPESDFFCPIKQEVCDSLGMSTYACWKGSKENVDLHMKLDKVKEYEKIRPELQWFAGMMEDKLSKNDWKGGWQNFSLPDLLKKLQGEVQELTDAINDMLWVATYNHFYGSDMPMSVPVNRVIMEAADVANFAMMAAERSNAGLKAKEGE